MKTILVTGGAGFIGSNFVNWVLEHRSDYNIIVLDALTYAGNRDNFNEENWDNPKFEFQQGNIKDRVTVEECVRKADVVLHLAAQTHVDNSILWCDEFINTNIKGTQILLDACKKHPVERFIYVSSSEVYGSAQTVPMTEEHPLNPQSPYAGTKAGADRLVYAYYITYKLPVVILRPFNNYGPNQHTEKLIPCFVTRALQDKSLPLHGDGSPSRDWVHTKDTCRAFVKSIETDLDRIAGQVINIGSGKEITVEQITRRILGYLGKPDSLIELLPDRRGQVRRHFASAERAKELLGWKVETPFGQGLDQTIQWYMDHVDWWSNLKSFPSKKRALEAAPASETRREADVQSVQMSG